jgi:hypothetical protein
MKNRIKIIGIALIIAGSLASCLKKDDSLSTVKQNGTTNSSDIRNAEAEALANVDWKIDSYIINGLNHSDIFNDYKFRFESDGTISAKSATNTVVGLWSAFELDGKPCFSMAFDTQNDFVLMNHQYWKVILQDGDFLKMKANRGDDGVESISFKKQ